MMPVYFQNITIPMKIYRGIKNILEFHQLPALLKVKILFNITEIPFFFLLMFVSFK